MLSYAGPLTFSLHARKTTLKLTAKSPEEADEWIGELQDVSALLSVYVYTATVTLVLCIHHMYCTFIYRPLIIVPPSKLSLKD